MNFESCTIKDVSDDTDSQVNSGYMFYLLERNIFALTLMVIFLLAGSSAGAGHSLTPYGSYHLYNNLVPPLLIYTDLLATGDTRNIETARIIYEKELKKGIIEGL